MEFAGALQRTYMRLGKSLARESEDGEELCLELNTPTYGEEPSGDEWGDTFHNDIDNTGWRTAEAVPALYYFSIPGDAGDAYMIRVVDDVLITFPPDSRYVADNTIACFKKYYHGDVSVDWDPTSFVGYALIDDPETGALTLNMASHVEHAVRQYLPELLEVPPVRPSAKLPKGQSFQNLADSLLHTPATRPLDERQTRVQRMVGAMRYPEKVLPVLTLGLHRLSCIAQNPPPAASIVADLLLEVAYDHRFEGLTFGGSADNAAAGLQFASAFGVDESDRPPEQLVAYGDATWTAGLQGAIAPSAQLATLDSAGREVVSRDLYSVILTFRGAAILHQTKKLALLVDCSMAAEEVATSKAAEYVEYAAQIMRALGEANDAPVTIGTDNVANRQVAMRQGAASRSKHLLRRYHVLIQRVRAGEVRVVHVRDEANPADFLTKWVSAKKLRASVAYVSGQAARRQGSVKQAIMKQRMSGM